MSLARLHSQAVAAAVERSRAELAVAAVAVSVRQTRAPRVTAAPTLVGAAVAVTGHQSASAVQG
jgi:hypothetical protein